VLPYRSPFAPIESLISSILLGYRALLQLYNIVTIAARWNYFRIRTSFIGDLDPLELERIGGLWPLSRKDCLLLQLTRLGYKDLSSGDYDPRRGLGECGPLSLERIYLSFSLSTLTWIGLLCRLDLYEYFFWPGSTFPPTSYSRNLSLCNFCCSWVGSINWRTRMKTIRKNL